MKYVTHVSFTVIFIINNKRNNYLRSRDNYQLKTRQGDNPASISQGATTYFIQVSKDF